MFVQKFAEWCNDRKPEKISRIWFGENLSGYMTNIQIYKRLLSNQEMRDITTCKLFIPGDYISWQTTGWTTNMLGRNKTTQISKIVKRNVVYSDICKPTKTWQMLFTHSTYDSSFQHTNRPYTPAQWLHNTRWCTMLKGTQIVLPREEDRKIFKDFLDDTFSRSTATRKQCLNDNNGVTEGAFQIAHRKDAGPYIYRNEYTGQHLHNMSAKDWHTPPSPNSLEINFATGFWLSFRYSSLKFQDREIGTHDCHTCTGKEALIPWVRIRGLCDKSAFDKRYKVGDDNIQGIYFQGERGTNITQKVTDNGPKKWIGGENAAVQFLMIHTKLIDNHTIEVTRAHTESPEGTFLLGKRTLKIEKDKACEPLKTNFIKDVVFSTCFDDEFTCDDGTCINMTKRCDNIKNCPYDMSDEEQCRLLTMQSSYRKAYAPINVGENSEIIKVDVNVSVDITNILRLSETQEIFETKLNMHLTWFDNRLQFNNLKLGEINMMEKDEQLMIWSPPAFFENTKDSERIVNDDLSSAYVKRKGGFQLAGMNVLYNTEVFSGDENDITLSRIYRHEFICLYQIAWYPFDTQRCRIVISLLGNKHKFVNLVPDRLRYLGPEDLTIYFIKNTQIHSEATNRRKVVYVEITLGRRLLSTVLTVYLPTVLLNVIGFGTNFFKVKYFHPFLSIIDGYSGFLL